MTNAYGILFIHLWDSTYSCQDDDQSHVTQDILRIDAHFPADISHLSITEVLWSWHVKVSLQMKIRLIWLTWARTTNNHLLILITKQTKWKTAFKTDRWWWALVKPESDNYMCVYTCTEVWRCSRLCLSQVGSWVTEGKTVVHRQQAETVDQRESSARMMDVVCSHQFYPMAKKGVAYPSGLKSTLQLALYVYSLIPLF